MIAWAVRAAGAQWASGLAQAGKIWRARRQPSRDDFLI
jgi:hypothetical protein